MKKLLRGCLVFAFIATCTGAEPEPVKTEIAGRVARTDRLIAVMKPGADDVASMRSLAARTPARKVHSFETMPGVVVIDLDPSDTEQRVNRRQPGKASRALALKEQIAEMMATGKFEFVEPDYEVRALLTPGDTAFTNDTLWALRNQGQNGGIAGADIEAVDGWDVTTGSPNVIVGVIDTGIRFNHQDLQVNMWENPGEIANNGIDDNGSGYIDDVHGINAINGSGNPNDDNGHGTHVAGTIAAAANGGGPHVGVAWNVRLMALKFLNADGSGSVSGAIECINYGVANGATILNNSWGGGGFSNALSNAITSALNADVVFVAAAGNESNNNDSNPSYPANYPQANVISVAALDRRDALASFSNFGANTVHLGAPGVSIYSTTSTSNSSYATFSGTSMAAPHVSGVAALIRSIQPGLTAAQVKSRLLGTVRPIPALAGRMTNPGSVSVKRSLAFASTGSLSASVSGSPSPLNGGQSANLAVTVTDGLAVTGATVTGSLNGGSPITFRDNGVSPDAVANDGTYSASALIPASGPTVDLAVNATASGKNPFAGSFTLSVNLPPPNDNLGSATVIGSQATSVTGSNVNATMQPGEPQHAGVPVGRSVWWSWTPSSTGTATVTTSGSTFDTVLAVYTGNSVGALVAIGANDDAGNSLQSAVTFSAVGGVTYRIAVAGYDGASGSIVLNVPPAGGDADEPPFFSTQPSNRTVQAGATATFNVVVSSRSPVFYQWQKDGEDLANDSRISGAQTASLSINFTTPEDDGVYRCLASNQIGTTPSSDAFLAVDGAFVVPLNDNFAASTPLLGADVNVSGSNVNATAEPTEPNHAGVSGGRSVWWSWTAPESGGVTINTYGSTYDTTLAVYTGAALGGLAGVVSNDDADGSRQSEVSFFASEGETYRIAVDGYDSAAGNISLNLVAETFAGERPDTARPVVMVSRPRGRLIRNTTGRIELAGRANAEAGLDRVEVIVRRRAISADGVSAWSFRTALPRSVRRRVVLRVRAVDVLERQSVVQRIFFRRLRAR